MHRSQNLRFSGKAPQDKEFEHPNGASIARLLQSKLISLGWKVEDFDNWRDCGWSFKLFKGNIGLELCFAEAEPSEWMLQISPAYVPSLLGLIVGKTPSANPDDCYILSKQVHDLLIKEDTYSNFKWRWDGFPDGNNSSEVPSEPK